MSWPFPQVFINNLALKKDGSLWAWGDNAKGELGVPSIIGYSAIPVRVQGVTDVDLCYAGMQYSIFSKRTEAYGPWD